MPTEVLEVTIDHVNPKGEGVAFYTHAPDRGSMGKSLVLFIRNVVPGDVVRVTVPNAKGRKRAQVEYDELLKPGPTRNLSISTDEVNSGGTPLKYMTYNGQLEYKEQLVHRYLAEEGYDTTLIRPILGMENPDRYRNKMDLTFGPNGELGMHKPGNYKRIIDLEDSIIAPKVMIEIKKQVSLWQKDHNLPGYNKETKEGILRNLMIRQSFATQEIMVVLFATEESDVYSDACEDLVERLTKQFVNLTSLLWVKNSKVADTMHSEAESLLYGRDYINDELNGFKYRIWHQTFFQASAVQAEKMVEFALKMAGVHSEMRVLDLFCGIGTFSLPFAKQVKELVGIELVEQSIESAKQNAKLAGIKNTRFFASDARKGLETLKESWATPDLLMINPPRSGAGGKLMRSIGRYGSDEIIYISCNPKTLAGDIKWLNKFEYELISVQPIDQFPHTVHVETIVHLSKTPRL